MPRREQQANWSRRLRELREHARTADGSIDVGSLLDEASRRGYELDWSDVALVGGFRGLGSWTLDRGAADFIAAYAALRPVSAVLDPWATEASLLGSVAEKARPGRVLGLLTSEVPQTLQKFTQLRNLWIEWRTDDGLSFLDTTEEKFDLVVCAPPWIPDRQTTTLELDAKRIEVADDLMGQLVARLGRVLSPDGEALVVVNDRFITDRRPKSARAQLDALGLHLRAAVAMPGAFGPSVSHTPSLAVMSRKPSDDLFVGEFRGTVSDELLANLAAHIASTSGEISLGARTDPSEFAGWRGFSGQERLDHLLEGQVAERVRLGDVATIGRLYIEPDDPLPTTPNAVYIMSPGRRPAATRPDSPEKGKREFVQLVVSEEHALAEYVAMLFNTPVGEAIRDATLVGAAIQRVSPDRLANVRLPLPPLDVQQRAISAERRLDAMQQHIAELRARLLIDQEALNAADELGGSAGRPRAVRAASADETDEETLRDWINTLPFPLASALLRFAKSRTSLDKIEVARHFFEATSMFFALVLVSAFRRDEELYEQEKGRWTESPSAPVHRFEHADFGGWVALGRNLAAASRQMQGRSDPRREAVFAGFTPRLVDALTNKKLWNTLDHARGIRNDRYHGGAEDERYRQALVNELQQDLSAVRAILGPSLQDVQLVRPGPSGRRGGIRHYRAADVLRGPDAQFDPGSFISVLDLDEDRLYLLPGGSELMRHLRSRR